MRDRQETTSRMIPSATELAIHWGLNADLACGIDLIYPTTLPDSV